MCLKIKIPANNIEERKYIVNLLLRDYLGIAYELEIRGDIADYLISFEDKELIIRDVFWNKNPEPLSYLSVDNFPCVFISNNQFLFVPDLPVLYGVDSLFVTEAQIICGIDLWASAFFMLTRWEEYVNKERDKHQRFEGKSSVAYKNDFLHRPLVNEYVEMLWNMLMYLGYKGQRKNRNFELVLTHDVDVLKSRGLLRTILGDILKRRNLKLATYRAHAFFKDPVDSYSFLMDVSERMGVKSHFYFMAASNTNDIHDDVNYTDCRRFASLLKEIRDRGHVIGFHPGYTTYCNEQVWTKQKKCLEDIVGNKIDEGRQHYLRIEMPYTLLICDRQGMKIDSTLGYADKEGFRCGTGDCFHVFDFIHRVVLNLIERPLVLMEGTLKVYQNMSLEEAQERISFFIDCGKKYEMPITFLFHNSSFNNWEWKGWKDLYELLGKYIY